MSKFKLYISLIVKLKFVYLDVFTMLVNKKQGGLAFYSEMKSLLVFI